MIWYEVNVTHVLGRYIFVDITQKRDLLAAARRSRSRCSSSAG